MTGLEGGGPLEILSIPCAVVALVALGDGLLSVPTAGRRWVLADVSLVAGAVVLATVASEVAVPACVAVWVVWIIWRVVSRRSVAPMSPPADPGGSVWAVGQLRGLVAVGTYVSPWGNLSNP